MVVVRVRRIRRLVGLVVSLCWVPTETFTPSAFNQIYRLRQQRATRLKEAPKEQEEEKAPSSSSSSSSPSSSSSSDPRLIQDPLTDGQERPLLTTLGGGPAMIFAMARRMLVWDEEESSPKLYKTREDLYPSEKRGLTTSTPTTTESPSSISATTTTTTNTSVSSNSSRVLPRWHPHAGISDNNPSFRKSPPLMNNQGYAATIWRNVRKRNKPSLWRHALRTYNRMAQQEPAGRVLKIKATTIHHEGALLACAKLGLWKEAMEIYNTVAEEEMMEKNKRRQQMDGGDDDDDYKYNNSYGEDVSSWSPSSQVTDNMISSLVKACVRGSKRKTMGEIISMEERRVPLDEVVRVLETLEERHNLPLVSQYVNPLAAAYQALGFKGDSIAVIQSNLADRTIGPEADIGQVADPFNVHDVRTKDKAAYSLLVQSAVADEEWGDAIRALRNMTGAGLYPSSRHVHSWAELSDKRDMKSRSRKERRDEYWIKNVHSTLLATEQDVVELNQKNKEKPREGAPKPKQAEEDTLRSFPLATAPAVDDVVPEKSDTIHASHSSTRGDSVAITATTPEH